MQNPPKYATIINGKKISRADLNTHVQKIKGIDSSLFYTGSKNVLDDSGYGDAEGSTAARVVGIGYQDFEQLIQSNYFYIDKTKFIKEWWENQDAVSETYGFAFRGKEVLIG